MADVCSSPSITVLHDGGTVDIRLSADKSLLSLLQHHDVEVAAVCGGCLSCGTCHVYIGDGRAHVSAPGEAEIDLLEASAHYDPARSRLACQVSVAELRDGMTITVAPDD